MVVLHQQLDGTAVEFLNVVQLGGYCRAPASSLIFLRNLRASDLLLYQRFVFQESLRQVGCAKPVTPAGGECLSRPADGQRPRGRPRELLTREASHQNPEARIPGRFGTPERPSVPCPRQRASPLFPFSAVLECRP